MPVVHSNPLAEPGSGDAGGMTVYVREVARALADRGISVDIFTRRDDTGLPDEAELCPGLRVIQIPAGEPGLSKEELPAHLPEFTANLISFVEESGLTYDVIHSHYWLSGKVASLLHQRWQIPFVHTFHTLGRVKNESIRPGEFPEPEGRLIGEGSVISEACAIVASTEQERRWLIDLYAAHPERIHLIAPGVDHSIFSPGDVVRAKHEIGADDKTVLLFVGRLQPLKAVDTALRAVAHLRDWGRITPDDAELLVVGGPSGISGATEHTRLIDLSRTLGINDMVRFVPAQPQKALPTFYRAADVCVVPSFTESFGLVALEAQASGVPVVASSVGGLRTIVKHGRTGYLVEPGATTAFAERIWQIISNANLKAAMGRLAVCSSEDFSWDSSAEQLHELYRSSEDLDCKELDLAKQSGKKLFDSRRNVPLRA